MSLPHKHMNRKNIRRMRACVCVCVSINIPLILCTEIFPNGIFRLTAVAQSSQRPDGYTQHTICLQTFHIPFNKFRLNYAYVFNFIHRSQKKKSEIRILGIGTFCQTIHRRLNFSFLSFLAKLMAYDFSNRIL